MITTNITTEQLQRAKTLYPFSSLNGSITKGKSNIYGAIGEIIIQDHYAHKNTNTNPTYHYDLTIENLKVDVKTKKTTVTPLPHYLCSISAFNTTQQCDYYIFCRVNTTLTTCFILGYKDKQAFFKEATFNKKGSPDVNGWTFKDDCYNLPIAALNPVTPA